MRGFFVTATDTGVGKTEVACALVAALRAQGVEAVGFKPAQSGVTPGELSDAERLAAASGGAEPPAALCPYSFAAPLAPAVAARQEGARVERAVVLAKLARVAGRHEAVVVEGAGGLVVALGDDFTVLDLMAELMLPAIVVARAGLGTVNHTALTVMALRGRGVPIAGVVLNRAAPQADPSEATNAAEIERLARVAVLASLPFVADAREREARLAAELGKKINFSRAR